MILRHLGGLILCLCLCTALAPACGNTLKPDGDSRPSLNLVLVVLDTTRPDYLSAYGHPQATSPYLDTFAAQATRFERAYSSSCWTLPAHATMFTGELPGVHRATQSTGQVDARIPLLAETLSDHGYATAGFSLNPWIGKHSGLSAGFETFERLESNKQAWLAHETDGAVSRRSIPARRVARWLRTRQDRTQPFFVFVNLMRAHHPYVPSPEAGAALLGLGVPDLRGAIQEFYPELPGGQARSLMNRHYARRDPLSAQEWGRLDVLYEGSLRSADDELRAVMASIEKWSSKQNTLVLVVSDHGESLGEHGHFGHILNLYETSVRVAFLARGPGFDAGASEDGPVHLADVHSTLLAAAGIAPEIADPHTTAGVDLAHYRSPQRIVAAALERPRLQLKPFTDDVLEAGALDRYRRAAWTAIGARYKLIVRSDGSEELYDLKLDPDELQPLAQNAIPAATLDALQQVVETLRKQTATRPSSDLDFDPEMLESLRGLGYVK